MQILPDAVYFSCVTNEFKELIPCFFVMILDNVGFYGVNESISCVQEINKKEQIRPQIFCGKTCKT